MGKKVEKLKKLYLQNGGSAEDVANIKRTGDMIDALCNLNLDSELPEVTGSDNGKVLGVVEGSWAKADVPTNDFVVNYTIDGNENLVADKTYGEILNAITSSKNVWATLTSGSLKEFLRLRDYDSADLHSVVHFTTWRFVGNDIEVYVISHKINGIITETATVTPNAET